MIKPTAAEEMRCVSRTLEQEVRQAVCGMPIESTVATLSHILRHALVRLELEGQVLFDDIAALRRLLPEIRSFLSTLELIKATQCATAIDVALAEPYCADDTYRSLTIMAVEAGALREQVYQSLQLLQETASEFSADAHYQRVRTEIRAYIARQIEQEGKLVEPAFFGHGARR